MKPTQNPFIKLVTWLAAEVVLSLVGLDNLADYSEFIFDSHTVELQPSTAICAMVISDRCDILSLAP